MPVSHHITLADQRFQSFFRDIPFILVQTNITSPMVLIAAQGTPVVRYEENGTLLIKGRWISENIRDFWQSLSEWGSQLRTDKLTVEVDLDNTNDYVSGYLSEFFKTLDTNCKIAKMQVNWYYEMGLKDNLYNARMISRSMHKARFKFCLNTDGI